MAKYFENQTNMNFAWNQVACAFWKRYPNPYSNHVLSEDVLWREVRDNKLYSRRLLTKTNRVPDWGKRFFRSQAVCIVEESVVDPIKKTIVTYTRNIGFTKVMLVEEKCIYYQSGANNLCTIVDRQAWISSGVYGFARAIQAFGMDRFRKNAAKACQGFQYVLESMYKAEKPTETLGMPLIDKAKIKETAKKATELAKSKAGPLMAACASNNQ